MASSAYFCDNITRLKMRIRIHEGLIEVKKLQIRVLRLFHTLDEDYNEQLAQKYTELEALKAKLRKYRELLIVLIAA